MTFDDWWDLFMAKWGKPKKPEQERLSRTFAKTAWDAGYDQRSRELSETREEQETGHHGFPPQEDK